MKKIIYLSFLLFTLYFLTSCLNSTEEKKVEKIIWSNKWFIDGSSRLKGAIVIDDKGTLLAVGQNFTHEDSVDYLSTLAKISPEGKILLYKHIGRTSRYNPADKKRLTSYDDRLIDILKTEDNRILVFGYKSFNEAHSHKLWVVEIDQNLNVLKDTVYMNLNVSNIGNMKAFNSKNGWTFVARNYWEENNLSRYRVQVYDFNNDYACTNETQCVEAKVDSGLLRMQWMTSVVENGNDLLLCGTAAITNNKMDDDDLKPQEYILQFNRVIKQTKVLLKCEENMHPIYIKPHDNQYCVIYKYIEKINENKTQFYHVVICYDSTFKELWRDKQQVVNTSPKYVSFYNEQWHTYGVTFRSDGQFFYEVIYDVNGKVVSNKNHGHSFEADFVGEIPISNNQNYRLFVDNGWRIDKVEF